MKEANNKVYYIGFYGDEMAYMENRHIRPSGVNKMDYIARAIGSNEQNVRIISPAWLDYRKNVGLKITPQRKFSLNNSVDCILPYSIAFPSKMSNKIAMFLAKIWLIFTVLLSVKKNDKVIVYHSTFYFTTMYWLKKMIDFNLILEVEEVYSEVFSLSIDWKKKEQKLIAIANSYIFPNDLMYKHLQIKNKPHVVIYGSYLRADKNFSPIAFRDGKIHLIYSGVIDKFKLGAFNAVRSAKFLPHNYVLHILGFGTKDDLAALSEEIEEVNTSGLCQVIYEGKKTGEDFQRFLSSCRVGLSTQKNEGEYLKITFPSKVLGYLTCGLNVVSASIDGVVKSGVGDIVTYYHEDSPESIAQAIEKMEILDPEVIQNRIVALDCEFRVNINKIL